MIFFKQILIATTLLLPCLIYSQDGKRLAPLQMSQDVDSLISYVEATHINPYYKYPKDKFYREVNSLKKKLTVSLDLIDFYLKIEPLLAKLQDGHTDLPIPKDIYNKQNPYELPYIFKLAIQKPYIVCQNAKANYPPEIPNNAEIISINGVSAKAIVNEIVNLNTGENPGFRAEYGSRNFSFYLETIYKTNGNYIIRYKVGKKTGITHIKGVRQKELLNRLNQFNQRSTNNTENNKRSYNLIIKDSIAIIDFKKFDWNGFKAFADSSFKLIKDKKIKNIIINLIDNGGGDSDVGDAFFQYIGNKPFRQYDKVIVKLSQLYKDRLLKNLGSKQPGEEVLKYLNKKNGTIDTFYLDNNSIQDNPLRFNENIYLLIDSQTYSSAADFAQCFKFYKRGTIVGEESGGLIKSFGDIVTTHLPNSGLRLTISSTLYYNVGANDNDFTGVIPDVAAPKELALKKALEIIGGDK